MMSGAKDLKIYVTKTSKLFDELSQNDLFLNDV